MRFDVVRGGGSEEARIPRRLRAQRAAAAAAQRSTGAGSSRSAAACMADRRARLRHEPDRRRGRGWARTERWTFVNTSNRVHPMHIHGFLFRVVERSSRPVHRGERRGWKDTVAVLPGETVTVQPWFAPYAGRYVFHCHALEHGDLGDDAPAGGGRARDAARRRSRVAPATGAGRRQSGGDDLRGAPAGARARSRRSATRSRGASTGTTLVHNVKSDSAELGLRDRRSTAGADDVHVHRRRARTGSSARRTPAR